MGKATQVANLHPAALTLFQLSGRYLLSQKPQATTKTSRINPTAAPAAGRSGSWCQAGGEEAGGTWLMMMTGGEGRATSRKILVASSRPSTNLLWPASNMPGDTSEEGSEDTDPIVRAGDDKEVDEDGQAEDGTVVVREDQAGEGTREDEEGAEDEEDDTGAEEEDTGAEKLSRTPASEDSMLYSTSILKEFSRKKAERRLM